MKIPARQRWKRNLVALALVAGLEPAALAQAGHQDGKVLIFAQPLARADAIWMAQAKGFFKEQKLDVVVRWWSSGTDALRVFYEGKDGKQRLGNFIVLNDLVAITILRSP